MLLVMLSFAATATATRSATALDIDAKSAIESLRKAVQASALDETQREAANGQIDAAATNLSAPEGAE